MAWMLKYFRLSLISHYLSQSNLYKISLIQQKLNSKVINHNVHLSFGQNRENIITIKEN